MLPCRRCQRLKGDTHRPGVVFVCVCVWRVRVCAYVRICVVVHVCVHFCVLVFVCLFVCVCEGVCVSCGRYDTAAETKKTIVG